MVVFQRFKVYQFEPILLSLHKYGNRQGEEGVSEYVKQGHD